MHSRALSTEAFLDLAAEADARWAERPDGWHAVGPALETRCGRWVEDRPGQLSAAMADRESVQVCSACLAAVEAPRPDTAGELLVRQFRLYHTD